MLRFLAVLFTGVIVSFYYFPFEFSFLPGLNTKMGLAVVGILACFRQFMSKRSVAIPSSILNLIVFAGLVSIIGVVSVTYNNTPDYAYATYIVSMLVWLSAAFAVCSLIHKVHGKLTVELIVQYIVVVCIVQCFLAIIIDANAALKLVVDRYIIQGQDYLNEVDRIYGIGANLDVAGTRFAAALIMIVFLLNKNKADISNAEVYFYLFAFVIIGVIGNMIARTTSVGIVIGLAYLIFIFKPFELKVRQSSFRVIGYAVLAILMAVPVFVYLYHNNEQIHSLLRFAFEGFFNLAETGEYSVASTEKLATMYVFPESMKTWIIGDGYFSNPRNTDPYFIGRLTGGYYMGTDVGYLRFIFYFGVIGLLAFSNFMVYASKACAQLLTEYKWMFVLLLCAGFIIWFKVSTDIFLVFALFLCVGNMQEMDRMPEPTDIES